MTFLGALQSPLDSCNPSSVSEHSGIELSVVWAGVDQLPVFRANQFLLQVDPDAEGRPVNSILTVGMVTPPVLLGTAEEQEAAAAALGAVATRPITRLSMGLGHLKQLSEVLQQHIALIEQRG